MMDGSAKVVETVYPYAPVQAPSHKVHVVELQTCDRPRMSDQTPMHMSTS